MPTFMATVPPSTGLGMQKSPRLALHSSRQSYPLASRKSLPRAPLEIILDDARERPSGVAELNPRLVRAVKLVPLGAVMNVEGYPGPPTGDRADRLERGDQQSGDHRPDRKDDRMLAEPLGRDLDDPTVGNVLAAED